MFLRDLSGVLPYLNIILALFFFECNNFNGFFTSCAKNKINLVINLEFN